jgi:hypothetical protein
MRTLIANLIVRWHEFQARRRQARDESRPTIKTHLTDWERQEAIRRVRRELQDRQHRW